MADIKHTRHEEAISGVKASNTRLLTEAEARRKQKPQELATKKMQTITEEMREPDFKIDYRAAARDLNRVQQELVTKEIEQKLKLELENEKIREKLNAFWGIRSRRNESTKQFEHKTKRDIWVDVRNGATWKQNISQ